MEASAGNGQASSRTCVELLQLATLAARMLQMACERDQIGRHIEILPHLGKLP